MLDLKHTVRQLLKSPGFTAIAVLTLGLCIGANLTIFAVVDAILVHSLPFPEADRLVIVNNAFPGAGVENGRASIPNYFERRGNVEAFESVSMFEQSAYTVGEPGSPRRIEGMRITPEFFETLGVPFARGQTFTDAELDYGPDEVAIISDGFWRDYFNADPDVLGRTFPMDSLPITVIGVLPADFRFLSSKAQIYRPLSHAPNKRGIGERYSGHGEMVVRLSDESSIDDAQTQIDLFNAQQLSDEPMAEMIRAAGYHTSVASLHEDHVRSVKPVLLLLQTGVSCLLLIGAVNLAGLLLIRASGRAKEMAMRQALGASRWDIASKILVETSILSVGGGVLGIGLGALGIRLIRLVGTEALPLGSEIKLDGRIAGVAILASIAVGICIALPIIWLNLRDKSGDQLKSETRGGTSSRSVQYLRHSFVVTQIALAFVLLCGAGLLGMSLRRTLEQSPGFEPDQLLTAQIALPHQKYQDGESRVAFVNRLLETMRTLPGVTYSAISKGLPFTSEGWDPAAVFVQGYTPGIGDSIQSHSTNVVSSDYWNAMNIPLLEGRLLTEADNAVGAPRVAVIDQAFALQYWSAGSVIGGRFSYGGEFEEEQAFAVVGVVGNVKRNNLAENDQLGAAYVPYALEPELNFRIVLRTSVAPMAMASTVQRAITNLDPELPVDDIKTMQARIDDSLVSRRSPAVLAIVFSGLALLLAAIGTYGVLAYAVAQRRREIGVRMALGAMPEQIRGQFLSLGLRLLAVGTVLGCFGDWAAGRAMQSILFDVPALHLPTLAGTALVMSVVTLLACLLPAMRASRVDPMEALRSE